MKAKTKKTYDCVEDVRKIREKINQDTAGLSPKEIVEYFEGKKKSRTSQKGKQKV